MRWAWPHLRRLWAGVGTVTAGLVVSWLYSLLSEQPLPHIRIASAMLRHDWPWIATSLMIRGRILARPQQVFVTIDVDANCGQHHMLSKVHPVDEQRQQLQSTQVASHWLSQAPLDADHDRSLAALLLMP